MKKLILGALAVLTLSGCVTAEQKTQIYASQRVASPAIKAVAIEYAKKTFFDPYTLRDVEISNVVTVGNTGIDAVCIRTNAKNRMGAYTGLQSTSLRIKDGVIIGSLAEAPGCVDDRLTYSPFPELENL